MEEQAHEQRQGKLGQRELRRIAAGIAGGIFVGYLFYRLADGYGYARGIDYGFERGKHVGFELGFGSGYEHGCGVVKRERELSGVPVQSPTGVGSGAHIPRVYPPIVKESSSQATAGSRADAHVIRGNN